MKKTFYTLTLVCALAISLVNYASNPSTENEAAQEEIAQEQHPMLNQPDAIATTSDGATAYVVSTTQGTVTPIDLDTMADQTPIVVGSSPVSIVINNDDTMAYVINYGDNTISPINLSTNTAETPFIVENGPVSMALSADQTTAVVTYENGSTSTIELPTYENE